MTVAARTPAPTVHAQSSASSASNVYEFELAWTEAAVPRVADERDRILAEAGRQISVFGDVADDWVRRSWLNQLVEEVRTRGEGSLADGLSSVAVVEMREAFARARVEFGELRTALAAGETMDELRGRSRLRQPSAIRDLGRMAEKLVGAASWLWSPAMTPAWPGTSLRR